MFLLLIKSFNIYLVLYNLELQCTRNISKINAQKQPSRGVLMKRCSENMQQIYRRTSMPKCDFNKVALRQIALWQECSSVNLLHVFRTPCCKNTSGELLLNAQMPVAKFENSTFLLPLTDSQSNSNNSYIIP